VRGVLTALDGGRETTDRRLQAVDSEDAKERRGRIRNFSGLPCAGSHGTERRELAAVQIWDTAFDGVPDPRDAFIGGAEISWRL